MKLLTMAQRHLLPQLRENFATYCKGGLFRAAESLVDKGYAQRSRYGDWSGGYYVRTKAGTELLIELGVTEAA